MKEGYSHNDLQYMMLFNLLQLNKAVETGGKDT